MKNKKITYKAEGLVYGKYWGGGEGAYKAESYHADTLEKLTADIMKDIESGAIDSGMGYEKVLGAYMIIDTITDLDVDGKIFSNVETDGQFFGDLDEKQQDFLLDCSFY